MSHHYPTKKQNTIFWTISMIGAFVFAWYMTYGDGSNWDMGTLFLGWF